MDRLKMHTQNQANENFRKLAELFPNAVTEAIDPTTGEITRVIDKDVLAQEISARVVDGREERYQFTWPDKKKAILAANAPIAATLRPVRKESVGKDGTPGGWDSQNLYIEGDNLDVLKMLQETYLGKIKMIYIDPPYNTGNDFVYDDDFTEDAEEYFSRSGQFDNQGNRLEQNTESNGRFHTDWCSMIYTRLMLTRNLLSDAGIIYISIDDHEVDNLKKICNEVYGEENFIACVVVENDARVRSYDSLAITHEYLLVYRRSASYLPNVLSDPNKKFKYYDSQGGFDLYELRNRNSDFNATNRPNLYYPFWVNPNKCDENGLYEIALEEKAGWIKFYPQESQGIKTVWRWGKEKSIQNLNSVIFGRKASGGWQVVKKYREETYSLKSVWQGSEFLSDRGTLDFKKLFDNKRVFSFPKSIELIKQCLLLSTSKDDIVLDFFSGSATTAHAVMQLNAEDGGTRRFIMVQLPEKTEETSEAFKAGYINICEIGKERIRRAGRKIKEESGLAFADQDTGFRVLRLDSSNMEDVYYNPNELSRDLLGRTVDNIKIDRSSEDLLFQVMLDLVVDLSSIIEDRVIGGKKVYIVKPTGIDKAYLVACFDEGVSESVVAEIAKMQPYYAVFRDNGMSSDSVATNFDQIFETYSSQTVRKVL